MKHSNQEPTLETMNQDSRGRLPHTTKPQSSQVDNSVDGGNGHDPKGQEGVHHGSHQSTGSHDERKHNHEDTHVAHDGPNASHPHA